MRLLVPELACQKGWHKLDCKSLMGLDFAPLRCTYFFWTLTVLIGFQR
jgi:hypothetical protein